MFLDYKAVSNSVRVTEKFRVQLWTNDNNKVKCLTLGGNKNSLRLH
jgi:hypothetical protein